MMALRTGTLLALLLLALAVRPAPIWADGLVFNPNGFYVPETAQQAFIEWSDGQESL
jgi:hypothetical protein